MQANQTHAKRKALYQYGLSKLEMPSDMNLSILRNHLFLLKMNTDYVINSKQEVDDLITFLNDSE